MRIVPWVAGDPAGAKACYSVTRAVMLADDPLGPPMSERVSRAYLTSPSEPAQTWFVPGDTPGSAQGYYHLRLPDRENRHRAGLYLEVHPGYRRRGVGRALLLHAAERAAGSGRSVLASGAILGSPGEAFAQRFGASPGLAEARRVLVLAKLPAGQAAELREGAERAAAGYALVTWTGRAPDEYLAGLATVLNAMSDAPRDADHEPRVWDAERLGGHLDSQRDLFGNREYYIAALHAETGEMAAVTHVGIDPEYPEWAMQYITAVIRPHRGHRLGLLVKAAMLDWLAAAEPAVERMVTWNAAENEHMIAINEALGYELLDPQSRGYDVAVADVLG